MFQIATAADAKNVFEESSQFFKVYRTRRSMGGDNISHQLFFDNIDFQVPVVFGSGMYGEPTISNLGRLTDRQYYHTVPHIILNGGGYNLIHFRGFKSQSMAQTGLLGENDALPTDVPLNIEIRGGIFKGAVRFSNSRIGNVKILGGVFEDFVVFERGVYGSIEILGGDFKKGIYFGDSNLFPNETPFVPPPDGIRPWTSSISGIFQDLILTLKGECDVTLTRIAIRNRLIVDIKQADLFVNQVRSILQTEYRGGKISESNSEHNVLELGNTKNVSRIQLSVISSNCNEITFKGLLAKESGIALNISTVNSMVIDSFVCLGSIKFDRLLFVNKTVDLASVDLVPQAQAFNRHAYYASAFHSSGNPEIWRHVLTTYEPALREIPTALEMAKYSLLTIKNSDLGKITFLQCSFSSKVSFENSKMNEIALIGSEFPTDRWTENTIHSQQRVALFQLRKVYDASGDSHQARRQRVAELEAYRKDLHEDDSEGKFTLRLNYWSNGHGESWTKALRRLIFCGGISWLAISFLCFRIAVDPEENFRIFVYSLPYFFEYLNPIHKFGFIRDFAENVATDKVKNTSEYALVCANLIDSLWRILSAYLIYQLVFAFRKHSK